MEENRVAIQDSSRGWGSGEASTEPTEKGCRQPGFWSGACRSVRLCQPWCRTLDFVPLQYQKWIKTPYRGFRYRYTHGYCLEALRASTILPQFIWTALHGSCVRKSCRCIN